MERDTCHAKEDNTFVKLTVELDSCYIVCMLRKRNGGRKERGEEGRREERKEGERRGRKEGLKNVKCNRRDYGFV